MAKINKGVLDKDARRRTRSAKRKEGWKQAWTALKNQSKNNREIAGTVVKGVVTKDVLGTVKNSGAKIVDNLKQGWNFAKGVFKGLFNEDWFYDAFGTKPKPATNKNRPMAPRYVPNVTMSGNYESVFAAGVGNVIDCYFSFDDIIDTEAFKLVTAEAFRQMRLELKSNLIETLPEFRAYVASCMSFEVISKQLERNIGMTKYFRPDLPDFQELWKCVVNDITTVGVAGLKDIVAIKDDEFPNSLTRSLVLTNLVYQLTLPPRLKRWIDWIAGSVFIDQKYANPQIYVPHFRNLPLYDYDRLSGSITISQYVDASDVTVDMLISYATKILDEFPIVNADIMKTEGYEQLEFKHYNDYAPCLLEDNEFFNLLINAYTHDLGVGITDLLEVGDPSEYIRIDYMPEIGEDNEAAVINGMGYLLANSSLIQTFKPLGQCLKLVTRSDQYVPYSSGSVLVTPGNEVPPYSNLPKVIGLMFTSDCLFHEQVNSVSTSNSVYYNDQSNATLSAVSTFSTRVKACNFTIPTNSTMSPLLIPISTSGSYKLRLYISGLNPDGASAQSLICAVQVSVNGGGTYNTYDTFAINVTVTKGLPGGLTNVTSASTSHTSASGAYGDVQSAITQQNGVPVNWAPADYFELDYITLSGTASTGTELTCKPITELLYFIQNVDYHIPIWFTRILSSNLTSHSFSYNSGYDNDGNEAYTISLIKECYRPVIVNRDDIKTTLYAMWASLLRISKTR